MMNQFLAQAYAVLVLLVILIFTDQSCKAEDGNSCDFPFNYRGNTYYQCTTFNSANGKAWCKTVRGSYVDCNPGCPGTGTGNAGPTRSNPGCCTCRSTNSENKGTGPKFCPIVLKS